MNIVTPYITLADADVFLATREPWASSTTESKEAALETGRVYMDYYYVSGGTYDEANAPDAVKAANALLANGQLASPLFQANASDGIKREKVRAGDVESDTTYFSSAHGFKDLYPEVTAMLAPYMVFAGSGMKFLARA